MDPLQVPHLEIPVFNSGQKSDRLSQAHPLSDRRDSTAIPRWTRCVVWNQGVAVPSGCSAAL